ncbi:sensor histidine kinase [Angustibacter sp. McL0619]|uniref:sensor histidine kinase n=1 Tax=Angustibacter sp. McL0619 TaxID=3415676 RepID=UPI003CF28679
MRRLPALRRRSRRDWLSTALVLAGLAGFVLLTYLVVVVVGALLGGSSSKPSLGLSVLATTVVALGFDPVLTRLERYAARVVQRGRPSPYDALRRFSGAVARNRQSDDLPLEMARLLVEGTDAQWAQVWVAVSGTTLQAAMWPPEAQARLALSPDRALATRSLPVRHGDEELGRLVLLEREGNPLTPVEERLFAGLASQAGLVLRGAQLRAALAQRLDELSTRETELRRSRERLVDAQDAARRRLERDIHDGAQQHLVALAVNLRLAASLASSAPERAEALLAAQVQAADDATATLVALSRGIYPPMLAEAGVAAAIRAVAGDGVDVVERGAGRYPLGVEAAAYFCCLEAIQNAAKHAGATTVRVEVDHDVAGLTLTVADDGSGFDPALVSSGSGLVSMRDRVDSAGGALELTSVPGRGTRLRAVIPSPDLATAEAGG